MKLIELNIVILFVCLWLVVLCCSMCYSLVMGKLVGICWILFLMCDCGLNLMNMWFVCSMFVLSLVLLG